MPRIVQNDRDLSIPVGSPGGTDRITPANALLMAAMHGRFYELSRIENLFWVANQAATATGIALTTTNVGLAISNPAGNNKDIVIEAFGFATCLAYVALSSLGIQGGYSTAGVVTHTTPLVVATAYSSLNLGSSQKPTALCDAACTTVNPRLLMPLGASAIATAVAVGGLGMIDIGGAIRLQPGAWCGVYTLTATSSVSAFWWSEEPR